MKTFDISFCDPILHSGDSHLQPRLWPVDRSGGCRKKQGKKHFDHVSCCAVTTADNQVTYDIPRERKGILDTDVFRGAETLVEAFHGQFVPGHPETVLVLLFGYHSHVEGSQRIIIGSLKRHRAQVVDFEKIRRRKGAGWLAPRTALTTLKDVRGANLHFADAFPLLKNL